jgi:hypothetical protein
MVILGKTIYAIFVRCWILGMTFIDNLFVHCCIYHDCSLFFLNLATQFSHLSEQQYIQNFLA